ncbi:MAG TPA: LuxR C-terminal-related transcriptional regulator [Amnibacterium sp.]|uniref:LuxR C-terminal-related transcriptional regulator n=1 Tax=Amnibacterium sp. TaxID=1872496 RepID=UPI002F94D21A
MTSRRTTSEPQPRSGDALGVEPADEGSGPSRYLSRERLVARLTRARFGGEVITVWGSVGIGKTTLLHQWAEHLVSLGDTVHWIDWNGEAEPALAVAPDDDRACPDRKIWWFGDDAHTDDAMAAIDGVVEAVGADHDRHRLVLAGRYQPSFLELRDLPGPIRLHDDDLAFTVEEAGRLAARFGLVLTPDDLEALVARTNGWAAGLALAMPYLASQPDVGASVARFGGDQHQVADYLASRVVDALDADDADLLMRAAVAPIVPMDLAAVVTARFDAGAALSRLSRENLLITEDREAGTFRYHPVLLTFMQAEARRRNETMAARAHWTAAEWYTDHGEHEQALEQALLTDDFRLVLAQVEHSGLPLLLEGHSSVLGRALRSLFGTRETLPVAVLRLAMDLPAYSDRLGAAEQLASIDRMIAEAPSSEAEEWRPLAVALRAFLSTDMEAASLQARALRPFLGSAGGSAGGTGIALMVNLASGWTGSLTRRSDAIDTLRAVEGSASRNRYWWVEALACFLQVQLAARNGDWRTAAAAEQRQLRVPLETAPPYNQISARTILLSAARTFQRGDRVNMAPAHRVVTVDPLGSEFGVTFPFRILTLIMKIDDPAQQVDHLAQLMALIRDEGRRYPRSVSFAAVPVVHWARRLYGSTVALEAAQVIIDILGPSSLDGQLALFLAGPAHNHAGEHAILDQLVNRPAAWGTGTIANAWIALAERADETHREAETVERLSAALRHSAEFGLAREFLHREGAGVRLLVKEAGFLGSLEPYAAEVVEIARAAGIRFGDSDPVAPMLTARELELLHELPAHQTVASIAAKRNVSVNTVKTHLRSIYMKLGASGRTEAIAAARRQNLL